MQLIRTVDTRVIASIPGEPQNPSRVLLVRGERVEQAVTIYDACAKLCVTHLLPKLLAAWSVLAEEVHVPGHPFLQRCEAISEGGLVVSPAIGNFLPLRPVGVPFHSA